MKRAQPSIALLCALALPACVIFDDGEGAGGDETGGADETGTDAGPGPDPDDTGEGGDGGVPTQTCHEYAPGEAGGADFVPLITESELSALDLTISYPDAPIAALDGSSTYLANEGVLRTTFVGLVEVDHDDPSTALSFNDLPLTGLGLDSFTAELDGVATPIDRVTCTSDPQTPISVIFVVDVTGSMSPVIAAVRNSLLDFVDASVGLGLHGKIGVVTYQDTVGVDIPFEDCSGVDGPIPERSPFFTPVALDDADGVDRLRDFIGALHADGGADWAENMAAAVDFAANNVIGYAADGTPNVIGEGNDDPPYTRPWPVDELEGLVVIIPITDASFHPPSTSSPSLPEPFRPRALPEILGSLGTTVVATIDPAFNDLSTEIGGDSTDLDADLFARYTGGFGQDWFSVDAFLFTESISFFDLELMLLGQGLLEIPLAPALASTCVTEIDVASAPGEIRTRIDAEPGWVRYTMVPEIVSY